jgi:hypothetical protein
MLDGHVMLFQGIPGYALLIDDRCLLRQQAMGLVKPAGGLGQIALTALEQGQVKTGIHMFRAEGNGLKVQGDCRIRLSLPVQVKTPVEKIIGIAGAGVAIFGTLPVCLHRA